MLGSGGAHFLSQHLVGRGRLMAEFKASLNYRASFRTVSATRRGPDLKQTNEQTKDHLLVCRVLVQFLLSSTVCDNVPHFRLNLSADTGCCCPWDAVNDAALNVNVEIRV